MSTCGRRGSESRCSCPTPCDLLPPGTHRMSFAEPWSILEPVNNGTVSCRPCKARTPSRSGLSADCCTGADIVTGLHRKDLPGKPDIAFVSRRKAIFVHGCYWHAHGCRYGRPPKSRLDYWLPKLKQNKIRDARKCAELKALGWQVLTIWQCEIKDLDALTAKLLLFLESDLES